MILITHDDDKINLTVKKLDLDDPDIEPMKYAGKDQLLFWSLKDTKDGPYPLFLNDPRLNFSKDKKTRPYLNISFIQEKVDWHKYDEKDHSKMYEHI